MLTTHGGPPAEEGPVARSSTSCSTGRARSSDADRPATVAERRRAPAATAADAGRRRRAGSCRCRRRASAAGAAPPGGRAAEADRGHGPTDPEAAAAGRAARPSSPRSAAAVGDGADAARARGLDPLTLRAVALDTGAGANLLEVLPLPERVQLLAVLDLRGVPAAVRVPARLPDPVEPDGRRVLVRDRRAHAAFEAFTKERRERLARGEPPPTREDLERLFRGRVAGRPVRRPDHRGELPAPGRDAARQLLGGRARAARRGASTRSSTSS